MSRGLDATFESSFPAEAMVLEDLLRGDDGTGSDEFQAWLARARERAGTDSEAARPPLASGRGAGRRVQPRRPAR